MFFGSPYTTKVSPVTPATDCEKCGGSSRIDITTHLERCVFKMGQSVPLTVLNEDDCHLPPGNLPCESIVPSTAVTSIAQNRRRSIHLSAPVHSYCACGCNLRGQTVFGIMLHALRLPHMLQIREILYAPHSLTQSSVQARSPTRNIASLLYFRIYKVDPRWFSRTKA